MAGWLLAAIVFLVAFGSLYPFSFSLAGAGPLERLAELPRAGTTRSDVAANILLYLPLGACLAWLIRARRGATLAVVGATLLAAAFSFAIEFAQLYETRRVASLADLASNATGAFLGALLALAIARTRSHLHDSPFAGLLRHPVAAALLFSWIGYRLAPFAPVLDTSGLHPSRRSSTSWPGSSCCSWPSGWHRRARSRSRLSRWPWCWPAASCSPASASTPPKSRAWRVRCCSRGPLRGSPARERPGCWRRRSSR